MAENDVDGDQAEGTTQTTNSESSAGAGASNSSFDATKLQSLIEGFGRRIEEIDARTKSLQGDKDRAVVKTKKEVEELKAKIAEYEKLKSKGMEPDDALEEMDFRQTVRQLQDQLSRLGPVQTPPAGTGASATEEAAKVIEQYKLDPNDPAVSKLFSLKGDALRAEAADMALRKLNQAPPDASAASSITGGPPPAQKGVEALTEEYKTKLLAAPRGPAGKAQRTTLRFEYAKKGVPVHEINI